MVLVCEAFMFRSGHCSSADLAGVGMAFPKRDAIEMSQAPLVADAVVKRFIGAEILELSQTDCLKMPMRLRLLGCRL
jgi:hypothetical protein